MKLPNIKIIGTGGTIAGVADSKVKTVGYKSGQVSILDLLSEIPEASNVANITAEQFCQIGSEHMTEAIWLDLAKHINELLKSNEIDGIVITHGTDTLEETAYFLNLTIKSSKPVVLVGAMRPATALSADGPLNLFDAILVAAEPMSHCKGVLICFGNTIISAREGTKTSTHQTNTFQGRGFGCIGTIVSGIVRYNYNTTKKHTVESVFSIDDVDVLPTVEIAYQFAGSKECMVRAVAELGVDAVVIAGFGGGNFNKNLSEYVKSLSGKPVIVRSTRVASGAVVRNGDINDDEYGTIAGDDLSPQKARILVMLALLKTKDLGEIQNFFYEY
ncbi:MAG: asparaginase [Defluviitaleaceae bacterium]|nr:asparaginase [Defluviitaleaceae bacterium]